VGGELDEDIDAALVGPLDTVDVAGRPADAAVTDDVCVLWVQAVSPRPITARQRTARVPDTEQRTLGSRTGQVLSAV
jgi:hypothetical protein